MSELPPTWIRAKIGWLCDLINGKAFKPSDWTDRGLPIVRIQNLNNPAAPYNHYDGRVEDRFVINSGQLLFAWSGTPGTSFGAHIWTGGAAVLNQHIFRVEFPEEFIEKSFLRLAINEKLDELIDKAHGGVGLRHLTKSMFEETSVELPPLGEQRRIVAKVDSLFAKTKRAREELARIPRLVKRYKDSILRAAFQGDLLPCAKAKPVHFQEVVSSSQNGLSKRRGDAGELTPVLRLSDLNRGQFAPNKPRRIALTATEQVKFGLRKGDLICIRVNGSGDLVGRMFVFPKDEGWAFCDHFIRFRIDERLACANYLAWFFASPNVRHAIETSFVSSAGQKTVSQKTLGRFLVPLPSLADQREIVRRIETAFAWIDKLVHEHRSATRLLDRLDRSILAKAFRGELVPQDPNDEPASVLLDRIRAERAKRRGRKSVA